MKEPCPAVPRWGGGLVDLRLAELVSLEQCVAYPKLEAVQALQLVESVLVEQRMVSPVWLAALAGLHSVELVLAHWPQEVCWGLPALRCFLDY